MNEIGKLFTYISEQWMFPVGTFIIIFLIIFLAKNISVQKKNIVTIFLGSLFLLVEIGMHILHVYDMYLNEGKKILIDYPQDYLPLHLCSITLFISIYLLFSRKQWAFEMALFIGLPTALHPIFTPQVVHEGNILLHKFHTFFWHGSLVFIPLYAIFVLNMWPRTKAVFYCFGRFQIIGFSVLFVNLFLRYIYGQDMIGPDGANYMFLNNVAELQAVGNMLIPEKGHWLSTFPAYVVLFDLYVLAHGLIIGIPFWIKKIIIKMKL